MLYLETKSDRYEITKQPLNQADLHSMKYRFSKVKEPFFKDNEFMAKNKRPLEEQFVGIIEKDLDWSDF